MTRTGRMAVVAMAFLFVAAAARAFDEDGRIYAFSEAIRSGYFALMWMAAIGGGLSGASMLAGIACRKGFGPTWLGCRIGAWLLAAMLIAAAILFVAEIAKEPIISQATEWYYRCFF